MTAAASSLVHQLDQVIAIHDAWIADEQSTEAPPQALLDAAGELFKIAHASDVRGHERKLYAALEVWEKQCRDFTTGMSGRNGLADHRFWWALRTVMSERDVIRRLVVPRIESVAELRRQKVSDVQIARQIYGHKGIGPFLDADGRILHECIDQEEKNPGSVVPADWVHPAEISRFAAHHTKIGAERAVVEPAGQNRNGPATVEGMLREGASVKEICKACCVSRTQVHTIADVLGIPIPESAGKVPAGSEETKVK